MTGTQVRESREKGGGHRSFLFFSNNKIAFSEKHFHGRLVVYKADIFQEITLQPEPSMGKDSRWMQVDWGQPKFHNHAELGSRTGVQPAGPPGQLRTN